MKFSQTRLSPKFEILNWRIEGRRCCSIFSVYGIFQTLAPFVKVNWVPRAKVWRPHQAVRAFFEYSVNSDLIIFHDSSTDQCHTSLHRFQNYSLKIFVLEFASVVAILGDSDKQVYSSQYFFSTVFPKNITIWSTYKYFIHALLTLLSSKITIGSSKNVM